MRLLELNIKSNEAKIKAHRASRGIEHNESYYHFRFSTDPLELCTDNLLFLVLACSIVCIVLYSI